MIVRHPVLFPEKLDQTAKTPATIGSLNFETIQQQFKICMNYVIKRERAASTLVSQTMDTAEKLRQREAERCEFAIRESFAYLSKCASLLLDPMYNSDSNFRGDISFDQTVLCICAITAHALNRLNNFGDMSHSLALLCFPFESLGRLQFLFEDQPPKHFAENSIALFDTLSPIIWEQGRCLLLYPVSVVISAIYHKLSLEYAGPAETLRNICLQKLWSRLGSPCKEPEFKI
ncbi:hypothetical protein L228DRAFT_77825 [Xylona heveae TC161]|uniref:Uncharacterized protein n=1 Tax=Xylona heveae (strain CBS 132557 / TC161) TaxID=1328760 RepID=A0A165IXB0_XYLHT|nr:hypothetical protein L228DRAFT_77825 [Xylona heveae TC161]KZF25502.1 hypothetical protein L228DRAFT_77825 [Xylona heveae TC161]